MFYLYSVLVSVGILTFTIIAFSATFIRYRRKCRCTKKYSREEFVLITGSAPGIALETAMGVIKRGGRVVLTNKNIAVAKKMSEQIMHKLNPESNSMMIMKLDFTSLLQVSNFVTDLKAALGVNQLAGIVITEELRDAPHELTEDGYDKMRQINYLGPYVLIQTIMDEILKNHPDPRIVTLSSGKCSPCLYEDIANLVFHPKETIDDRNIAYQISKISMALMSLRWEVAYCVDPGNNIRDKFTLKKTPLKGVEGVLHELLKPPGKASYADMRRSYANISHLCVGVIDKLENNKKDMLTQLLFKSSYQLMADLLFLKTSKYSRLYKSSTS